VVPRDLDPDHQVPAQAQVAAAVKGEEAAVGVQAATAISPADFPSDPQDPVAVEEEATTVNINSIINAHQASSPFPS